MGERATLKVERRLARKLNRIEKQKDRTLSKLTQAERKLGAHSRLAQKGTAAVKKILSRVAAVDIPAARRLVRAKAATKVLTLKKQSRRKASMLKLNRKAKVSTEELLRR